jgi:hypothetical protein
MNKERADEHSKIFLNLSFIFTFDHDCPVLDRASPILPRLFQKGPKI